MNKEIQSYKTSLCRHYMSKGNCSLYEKCHFAHGEAQLRKKVDPVPKYVPPPIKPVSIYKTQLCKYFMNGFCRNEKQCSFAHGMGDMHSMLVTPTVAVKPDYAQASQFLFTIIRNLEQVFPDDIARRVLIKKGMELLEEGELHEANQIINELVNSSSLTKLQKEQCQTILSNAYSLHKINSMPF